jgi:hypothetical protein
MGAAHEQARDGWRLCKSWPRTTRNKVAAWCSGQLVEVDRYVPNLHLPRQFEVSASSAGL